MDTDFRMFSYRHKGTLPGIDIAQILDGSAYHSKNDNSARIRKGTLQVCPVSIIDMDYACVWNMHVYDVYGLCMDMHSGNMDSTTRAQPYAELSVWCLTRQGRECAHRCTQVTCVT
jgi:hypothetical protein